MPKFLFISHRGTTLKPPVFLFKSTVTAQTGAVYWPNRAANRWKPVELSFLVWNLNLAGFFWLRVKSVRFTRTGRRWLHSIGREKNLVIALLVHREAASRLAYSLTFRYRVGVHVKMKRDWMFSSAGHSPRYP